MDTIPIPPSGALPHNMHYYADDITAPSKEHAENNEMGMLTRLTLLKNLTLTIGLWMTSFSVNMMTPIVVITDTSLHCRRTI